MATPYAKCNEDQSQKLKVAYTMSAETMWYSEQLIFNQLKSFFGMALMMSHIQSENTDFALAYRLFFGRIGLQ